MLRAVEGNTALVGGVELQQLLFIQVGQFGDARQIHVLLDCDLFEVGFVGDWRKAHAVGFRRQDHLRQRQ